VGKKALQWMAWQRSKNQQKQLKPQNVSLCKMKGVLLLLSMQGKQAMVTQQ
jgi:hypothetical protein